MKKRRHKRRKTTVMSDIGKGQNPAGNAEGATANNQSAADNRHATVVGPKTNPKPNTMGDKPNCKSKDEHWSVKILALVAAIGGFIAAIFTGAQWWVAWDAEIVSNRAFVISNTIRLITYGAKVDNPDQTINPRWILTAVIQNVGNTQTRKMRLFEGLGTTGADGFWKQPQKNEFVTTMIGPKSEITGSMFEMGPNILIQLRDRRVWIGANGIAKYEDIFGKPHLTEFCYVGIIVNIDFKNWPPGQPINSASIPCKKHNCADEECGPDWKQRATE